MITHTHNHTHPHKMIALMAKDPWTLVSFFVIVMMGLSNWVAMHVNPILAGLTGVCALVLTILGIIEKWLIVKQKLFDNKKPKLFCPHPLYDNFGEAVSKEKALKFLGLKDDCAYLLFFGFIRDYKGLDLLLEALSDDRFKTLNVKLIVAGEYYSDPRPYREIIQRNNIHKMVIEKTSFIPNDEVVNYFCAADLVVQPYKSATQSGVTQIAYHFEKAMLVTNVGGLPEMIPDGKVGYVVAPESKAIADALVDFFENKRETFFVSNVKEEKKKYSWQNLTNSIKKLIEN